MMKLKCLQCFVPMMLASPPFRPTFHHSFKTIPSTKLRYEERRHDEYMKRGTRRGIVVIANGFLLPVDPWAPNIDSQSIASQLFAFSLFPYIGFLYFITKSKSAPNLTLFGFYFLLAFVGATIPAGIYAKVQYGTSLSNVDYLHGGAESLLTLTNLFIVLGLRAGLRSTENEKETTSNLAPGITETDDSAT